MSPEDELFEVKLNYHHPDYQSITLRRRPGYEHYKVVEVDMGKLIHYSNQDLEGYVLLPSRSGGKTSEREFPDFWHHRDLASNQLKCQ